MLYKHKSDRSLLLLVFTKCFEILGDFKRSQSQMCLLADKITKTQVNRGRGLLLPVNCLLQSNRDRWFSEE